ncbi:hypothetical protein EVAR_50530_1 [Eumeta japonica]|uniref:Uncharacterized protein n=1 Tax=Eumeta variegata TaxID=151549 RepID=A0A4C1YTI8_EUMVA|nr:hypothetical protein EVAR_50530_1 [Eumeta japonica]
MLLLINTKAFESNGASGKIVLTTFLDVLILALEAAYENLELKPSGADVSERLIRCWYIGAPRADDSAARPDAQRLTHTHILCIINIHRVHAHRTARFTLLYLELRVLEESQWLELKDWRVNAEVMILTLDHGVPRPAPTQAPPREALHPASAAVASDCSGETRAAEVLAPSDDRNTIEDPLPSLAKNGRVNSETTNDLEPGDYSSSGSSWAPDQQSSSDSESEETKRKEQPRPTLKPKPALSTRRTPNRSAITTKCADENKMLKLQMQKKQRQKTQEASAADKDLQKGAAAEVTSE